VSALAMAPIGGGREWVGKIFFVLAMLWFGAVFWVMRPDLDHVDPRPTPIVVLPDGTTHKVYLPYEIFGAQAGWVESIDVKTRYSYAEFLRRPLIRFIAVALAPPVAGLIGAMMWLLVSDLLRRRSDRLPLED
jgi:hypothetical protein